MSIMRPHYNSNMAKVSIVKWSQNLMFVVRSPISGLAKKVKDTVFKAIFQNLGYARKGTSG